MHKPQALDGCLNSIDDLRRTIDAGISNEDVLSLANTLPVQKLFRVKNERLIDNVHLARSVFKPNPYYGTRLACNTQVLIDVDEFGAQDLDLFMTDSQGIPKNRVGDEDTSQKITRARALNQKIITFFGGSTTMGTGARLPAFAIPSLVEQILKIKYQLETVCVNRGILGMTSQDSFNILTAQELRSPPDCVVFYTGWNCVFNQSALHALIELNQATKNPDVYLGMSTRHIEHGIHLKNQLNVSSAWNRALWLSVNNTLTYFARLSQSKKFRTTINQFLQSDQTVNHSFMSEIIEAISNSNVDEVAKKSAQDYLRICRLAKACCETENVAFLNFFQPCLSWGNKPTTQLERTYLENSPKMGDVQHKFYQEVMSHPKPAYFKDLSSVFNSTNKQTYIDSGHLNPYGNFIVAEKIADQLSLTLSKTY